MVDLMDPTTYHHSTRNPSRSEPEEELRYVFKRIGLLASRIPLWVLQALADAGYTRIHTFAGALGETRAETQRELLGMPEVSNNLSARMAESRAELAFLLSVWDDLHGRGKSQNEIKHKNRNVADPVAFEGLEVEKVQGKNRGARFSPSENPIMWTGFALPVLVSSCNALHALLNFIPLIQLVFLAPIFRNTTGLIFGFNLPVVGFTYLINLEIDFSLGF